MAVVYPSSVFSTQELEQIAVFCHAMGLDYGKLDIMRDTADQRMYILDANTTPGIGIRRSAHLFLVEQLAQAFVTCYPLRAADDDVAPASRKTHQRRTTRTASRGPEVPCGVHPPMQSSQRSHAVGCRGADRWVTLPNGAQTSPGRRRRLMHQTDAGAVAIRVFGEGVLTPVRLPPHLSPRFVILSPSPPVLCLPSTGRELGAPRSYPQLAAAFPCPLSRPLRPDTQTCRGLTSLKQRHAGNGSARLLSDSHESEPVETLLGRRTPDAPHAPCHPPASHQTFHNCHESCPQDARNRTSADKRVPR